MGPEERMMRRVCAALGVMVVAMLLEMVWEVDDRWVATTLIVGIAVTVAVGAWRPRTAQAAPEPQPRTDPPAGRGEGSTAPKPDPASTVTISPPAEYFARNTPGVVIPPENRVAPEVTEDRGSGAPAKLRQVPARQVPARPVPDLRLPGESTES
jgi:hypothetical protein